MASIEIPDGVPYIWDSQSIRPSTSTSPWPTSPPTVATIHYNSTDIYVYVEVVNTSNPAEIVGCPVGPWNPPPPLSGFVGVSLTDVTATNNGWLFTAPVNGADTLVKGGVGAFTFANPPSRDRAWGWSPDGRFFAYVFGPTAGDNKSCVMRVYALDGATRFDGSALTPGTKLVEYPLTGTMKLAADFDNATFHWVGSNGLIAIGALASGGSLLRALASFRNATPGTYPHLAVATPNVQHLVSPCGSTIAYVEPSGARVTWVSTVTGGLRESQVDTGDMPVDTSGPSPSIETIKHTARGVEVRGSGAPFLVDDPDHTADFNGLDVIVHRMNLGTVLAGAAAITVGRAGGPRIAAGASAWIQIPKPNNWANNGTEHWCLVAQAYQLSLGITQAWSGTGWADLTVGRVAQRNIEISNT